LQFLHVPKEVLFARSLFPPSPKSDKLCGCSTTDCLGHMALITELFIQQVEKKPKLKYSVAAVFIAWWVELLSCYQKIWKCTQES